MLINLARIAPKYIQNSQFWLDYLEACSKELNLVFENIRMYKDYYVPFEYWHTDRLISLCKDFGDTPNMILANKDENWKKLALNHARVEADSLAFKIMYKGTYKGLTQIFARARKPGKLFIIYHDNARLRRAIDYASTVNLLENSNGSEPFTGLVPFKEFDGLKKFQVIFDKHPLLYFDDKDYPWFFDQSTAFHATTAIAMEYDIDKLEKWQGRDCLLNPAYFQFLEVDIEKTREATTIPYPGAHLEIVIRSLHPYFNKGSYSEEYTVPKIKMQAGLTPFFKKEVSENTAVIVFDEKVDAKFDSETHWDFDANDATYELKEPRKLLYRFVFGTGKAPMLGFNHASLYEGLLMCLYWQDVDQVFLDLSPNRLHDKQPTPGIYFTEIPFFTKRIPTALGSNPDFQDDMEHVLHIEDVIFEQTTNKTWLLRVKQEKLCGNDATLLQYDGETTDFDLKVVWVKSEAKYKVLIDNDPVAYSNEIIPGDDIRILMEFENLSDPYPLLHVEIGGEYFNDVGLPGYLRGHETVTLYGTNSTDVFKGAIYDVRVYSRLLNEEEKIGLDTGLFSHIQSPCYYGDQNMYALSDPIPGGYELIQTRAETNTVKDVCIGFVSPGVEEYEFDLPYNNVTKKSLKLKIEGFRGDAFDVEDDGFGRLVPINPLNNFSGVIDYQTGKTELFTYKTFDRYNDEPLEINQDGQSLYDIYLKQTNLVKGSIKLRLDFLVDSYEYIEDENGLFWIASIGSGVKHALATDNVTGGDFIKFEVDYETGYLTLERETDFQIRQVQLVEYKIKLTTFLSEYARVNVNYKSESPLELTEVAVLDDENIPVLYASFPPFISESSNNHVSVNWFMPFV